MAVEAGGQHDVTKAANNCGIRWLRDEGGMSIWEATADTCILTLTPDSSGRNTEMRTNLFAGQQIMFQIGVQSFGCC